MKSQWGGPIVGVPELIEPGVPEAVKPGELGVELDLCPTAAATPPIAAPTITTAITIFFDRPACSSGSTLVSLSVADSCSPFTDAITRNWNWPAMPLGRKP